MTKPTTERHNCSDEPGTCGHTIVVEGPPPLDPLQQSYERALDEAVAEHKREGSVESTYRLFVAARQFATAVRR